MHFPMRDLRLDRKRELLDFEPEILTGAGAGGE
jgi:hypothetical protein